MSSSTKKVVLWSKTGCHFCGEVKAFLTERNQPFENIEVQGNDVLRDVLEAKYGIRHVPVIEVGGDGKFEALLEPDLEKLAELLAQPDEAAAV
ncbi:MAG: glutaredoxin family protein [Paenibacillus sp.]|uniref:glutaredoxin family protein n=1 Tax=unclassified Paenibacillus TaxID=185978 RepID=UPI00209FFA0C|nr:MULTISPECIES: glutaredoxin family protein [Paenibacillus]MCP1186373.1 glutaredoxin family protein [Paenibacillus sp. 1781tsa1]MDT9720705.1 glutaredoxin family protein [Paenibacillus sp. ClWae2A]WFR64757.1 glutaredoxin family protein [Paenibacillus amylolyticus]